MKTNRKGIELIKSFEGCRLNAYKCSAGKATIGWGSTTYPGLKMGMTITQEQADEQLLKDLAVFEEGVTEAIGKAETNENQFAAMVSFAYNLGVGALKRSSVLRYHKIEDYDKAKGAFGLWVMAKGRRLEGLVRRRAAEAELYGSSVL